MLAALPLLALLFTFAEPAAAASPSAAPPPAASCRDGWTSPAPGSAEYEQGLAILANYFGVTGGFEVAEIRYFTGPDSPGVIEPRFDPVLRWYLKVTQLDDPTWQGRFLVEYRTDTRQGVSAAAPFDTTGYQSPDWRAFEGDGEFREVPGLPGLWAGAEYDFVTGDGGSGNRGLPPEVEGCMTALLPTTH